MDHDALLAEYDRVVPALHEQARALCERLSSWLPKGSDSPIKVHSVTFRVKSRESLARKLARPDRTYRALWDVTDLVGLRVITYFEDGIDRVGSLIEERLPVDFVNSVDKRAASADDRFGYRSLHYVCRLALAARASELACTPHLSRCEIQVRTMLEHAWAEIEHDLGYKTAAAVPTIVRRRFQRLAGLLELADQEFVAIRRELESYAAQLPARLASDDALPLDRLTLDSLLACEEARALDRALADLLGKPCGDTPFFPEYLLKMLHASGISTVADARLGLRRYREEILAMVEPYFTFATAEWSLSPERMTKVMAGYSLFFLAHVAVLEAENLGINKVERLARLYRELDYPDDERAAQRVASQLVEAFREVL